MPTTTGNLYGGGSPLPETPNEYVQPSVSVSESLDALAWEKHRNNQIAEDVIPITKRDIDILIRHQIKSINHFGAEETIVRSSPISDKNDEYMSDNINYLEKQVKRLQQLLDMRKKA